MALAFSQILPWEEQQTGFWDLIVESNKKAGFFPLGRASVFQNCFLLYTKFPLSKPQELSGHKFRGVSPYTYFQKALGIVSVSISNTEAYGALQQGLIDGVTWKEEAVISYKLNEVGVKYVIDYPYAQDDLVFLMSVTGFNRLPQNLQKVLTDSARATERANYEMWNSQAADWRQTILKLGFSVVKFSPEDAKWYTDLAYSSGWAAVLEKNPVTGPKLKELSLKK
jgi:TRAP-type C4-dicarboxylate transport system substrate-binding protein